MQNNQNIYKDLKKKYSKKELAENFYVSKKMTPKEKKQSDDEIWNIRKKKLQEMSPEDKVYSGLLRLKYQIKNYIDNGVYDESKSAATYLKEYMDILNKKQKDLSIDLDIHKTRLSRILNNRERISLQLAYRLEIHSGELIPAILWWRLVQKEIEKEIMEDKKERKKEKRNVKNIAYPCR